MLGMSPFGVFHTLLSLVAVAAGVVCLARDKKVSLVSRAGQLYVGMTALSCLTGFGIFHHGGFGKPHVLGIVTLVTLGVAVAAERRSLLGGISAYVAMVGYSLTLFFHSIPAITETSTRLPAGAPLATGPDDPALQTATGLLFTAFLIGAIIQVLHLRGVHRKSRSGSYSPRGNSPTERG